MGYSSGLLDKKILVLNRKPAEPSVYGVDGDGIEWEETACLWANVTWAKGVRSLNAGALDAYAIVIVRIRWTNQITMRSRIVYEGQTYQILAETFHADKRANTIQFNAQAIVEEDG